MMFELVSSFNPTTRVCPVKVILEDETHSCSYHYFERNGIICSHIIRPMVQINVQVIHDRYMLERWSEAATISLVGRSVPIDFVLPWTKTLQYNSL
jgi:hypothetical protein